jgi:hypothetical protein
MLERLAFLGFAKLGSLQFVSLRVQIAAPLFLSIRWRLGFQVLGFVDPARRALDSSQSNVSLRVESGKGQGCGTQLCRERGLLQ